MDAAERRRVILSVLALGILGQICFIGLRMMLLLNGAALGSSTASLGVLQALFMMPTALLSIRIGRLIDRLGPRGPMLLSLLALVISPLLPALAPGLPALYVAAMLSGSAATVMYMIHVGVTGRTALPEERLRYMTLSSVVYSMVSLGAPLLGGVMIDTVGHRWAYLALGPWPLIAVIAILVGVRGIPGPSASGARPGGRGAMDLLREPDLRAVYVVSTCLSIIIESYSLLIPLYGTARGLSATSIGLMISTMSFAMLGIRAAAPLLARAVPHRRLLVIALFQASLAYAIYPLVDSMAIHLALAVMIGSAVGLTQPMTMVMLYELAPRGRDGEAVGLRQLFVSSGQVGVPLAFGALAGVAGLLPAFWIIAALGFGGAIYGRRTPARGRPPF